MVVVRVSGPRACFTRPDAKVDRDTYPIPTPQACQSILGAVYAKPEFVWKITKIHVLSPFRYAMWMGNEVVAAGDKPIDIANQNIRTQRRTRYLRDVDYLIEAAAYSLTDDPPRKHSEIFSRYLERGRFHHQPYLGVSQFLADLSPVNPDNKPVSPLLGEYDLGRIFHSTEWSAGKFRDFHAVMIDGIVEIPDLWGNCETLRNFRKVEIKNASDKGAV